jgi:hypothetical protein
MGFIHKVAVVIASFFVIGSCCANAAESDDKVLEVVASKYPTCKAVPEVQWMCTGLGASSTQTCGFFVEVTCPSEVKVVYGRVEFEGAAREIKDIEITNERVR